ncbi:MAG: polyhydroxyalkanoic acid system family protein [Chloroflexi bacterium]|nr:polyhydroxyalkanoic acid system family protein [Chloroflexota bacterium]
MKVSFPHGTTKAMALGKLKTHSSKLIARFGSDVSDLQQEWQENELTVSFKAFGFSIQGRVVVEESTVEVEINLPLPARLMEGRIRDRAVQAMQEIFQPELPDKGQSV